MSLSQLKPLNEIISALSERIPDQYLSSRKQGGSTLSYVAWHNAVTLLDQHCPGWKWEIRSVVTAGDRLVLTGRLTVNTAEGEVYREATGTELLDCGSYGDPSSNAESMAFRRAASKFGLGLYLYRKDEDSTGSGQSRTTAPAKGSYSTTRPQNWTPAYDRPRQQPKTFEGVSID